MAMAINDSGQAVGYFNDTSGPQHAFLYSNGNVTDLGSLGGQSAAAFDLNNAGQITGYATLADNSTQHAFLITGGKMQDIGTLGGTNSGGRGVNSSGSVTGSSEVAGCTASFCSKHAFLYSNGKMTDLGLLPGGASSFGIAVNDRNDVVGWGDSNNDGRAVRGIIWSGGNMTALDPLPNRDQSSANGINNGGVVVGASGSASTRGADAHAIIYANGKMQDLNDLIPSDSGWTLQMASDINDKGQIVGTGLLNSQQHAFLLTPAP
jgi:probable HAF family extracellular repeat protein